MGNHRPVGTGVLDGPFISGVLDGPFISGVLDGPSVTGVLLCLLQWEKVARDSVTDEVSYIQILMVICRDSFNTSSTTSWSPFSHRRRLSLAIPFTPHKPHARLHIWIRRGVILREDQGPPLRRWLNPVTDRRGRRSLQVCGFPFCSHKLAAKLKCITAHTTKSRQTPSVGFWLYRNSVLPSARSTRVRRMR